MKSSPGGGGGGRLHALKAVNVVLRDAVKVVQFNLRAFFSVRTWPWMMLFYKLRPMLRSAQVEKELTALNEDFTKLKDAFDRLVSAKRSRFLRGFLALPCIFLTGVT